MTTKGENGVVIIEDTICINSKVNGKQPLLGDRIYDTDGCSPCIATAPFYQGKIVELCVRVGEIDNPHRQEHASRIYSADAIAPTVKTGFSGWTDTKIADSYTKDNVRIRALTEREDFRLQGVKDEDYERVRKNQSKSSAIHLAGDSITTTTPR